MKQLTHSLTILSLATSLIHSEEVSVLGSDFEIYKPGSNYTIGASFPAGSFGRGVGNDLEVGNDASTVIYDDGTDPGGANDGTPDFDLPGWVQVNGGLPDTLSNGVDGSTGMNLFAAWGGDMRIESSEALGTIQPGSVYTISIQASGPGGNFVGPITQPLAFHLTVEGEQLTPSEIVDPDPLGTGFQTISRTYDASSISDYIGKEFKILLGVEDENEAPNRVIFDNLTLEIEGVAVSSELTISANEETPGTFDFTWGSQAGSLYNLVSNTDLSTSPDSWEIWEGQSNIEGTGSEITLDGIAGGNEVRRFFAIVEVGP